MKKIVNKIHFFPQICKQITANIPMTTLIKNARIINEGSIFEGDVFIQNDYIHTIGKNLNILADNVIEANANYLIPGIIDDQVHFREPGLTHKGEILTESRAAVAGGITTFMEMPNTHPATLTQALLEEKYQRAAAVSPANFSFFMGASNDNLEEVLKTNGKNVCGIKVFMGSSTGNMLVDNETILDRLFANTDLLIATHCEDEATVKARYAEALEKFGENIPIAYHPIIRNHEACLLSSTKAIRLAQKHNTRLHILHISTAQETQLFDNTQPLSQKRITSEACVHHLWFTDADYESKGTLIKWNPAVKTAADREAIRQAVNNDRIDIIATDHAPHTWAEKQNLYPTAPSGGPLVQHSLAMMWEMAHQGVFTLEKVVEKMSHSPAVCFQIEKRGFIREGYFADLVLVDAHHPWEVNKSNLFYKCGWSPLEGATFQTQVLKTWVNGQLAYSEGKVAENVRGKRITFER